MIKLIPDKIVISRRAVLQKEDKIKHLFKCEDGFILHNLKFKIKYHIHNPKKMRLHIHIWLPFIHIIRDNCKLEIGNRYRLYIYH
jgi:hypothetical protein